MSTRSHPRTATDDDRAGLAEDQMGQLVSDIKDYQLTHGNLLKLVRFEEATKVPSIGAGVSALPTLFPRRCFDEAWNLQRCMNELYIRVATDEQWLYAILQPLMEHDSFLAALWGVHLEVKRAGVVQEVVCGIFRSDYMLHKPSASASASLKQVEMNTFSVAGACHAEHVAGMHHHLDRVRKMGNVGVLLRVVISSPPHHTGCLCSFTACDHSRPTMLTCPPACRSAQHWPTGVPWRQHSWSGRSIERSTPSL